jgi:hypothetical protein|tara:strand:- start:229 stop:1443 length:1215 start_codon:yes stop_codon:yes gene_type:complete
MKKLSLLVLFCCCIQLSTAQNFRKPYREAKRALKKKDFVTATLKSIESLKAKKNWKKSNDIFEEALSKVNGWASTYIKDLETKAIPYKDFHSVAPMKKIFITYANLDKIQKKLFELSAVLSSKQKKFIALHTMNYEKKRSEADNLLKAYNTNAADEFYTNGLKTFNNAANKYDYKKAYKTFESSLKYIANYKDVQNYLDRSLQLGTLNVGYFPMNNFTNTSINKRAMKNLINSTIGLFNKYQFANYSDISNKIELRKIGALGEKGREELKNIDEFVKFNFLKYYAGPTVVISKVFYEKTKTKKKKDGSIKTWYCKGYIYEVSASGSVEVDLEFLDNNGDILDSRRINVRVNHNDKFFLASKGSDRRANSSGKRFITSMPEPFDMVGAIINRFNTKVNGTYKRYD